MLRIRMETDEVRMMAANLRRNADAMEAHMTGIQSTVLNTNWQSNARDEFVNNIEILMKGNAQAVKAMRLMARAAERKADQWEAIGNKFMGPFYFLEGIWASVLDHLNNTWQGILNSLGNIRWPSFALVSTGLVTINGWFKNLVPPWDFTPPPWWPFNKKEANDSTSIAPEEVKEEEKASPEPKEPIVEEESKTNYPVPPNDIGLVNTNDNRSCARYAASRRPDLGTTQCNNEKYADQAAANYICKFEDKVFQINESENGNLTNVISEGYAIVWEPGHESDSTYGHVAIVEEVYTDYVIFSHATKVNGVYTIVQSKYTFEQLNHEQVWLIP